MVNYLHKILVKIPTINTSSAYICHCTHLCIICSVIHLSDDECQEIPDKISSTNYGEKFLEITAKFPDDVTLTLCNVKFLEKDPGNSNEVKYLVEFPSG